MFDGFATASIPTVQRGTILASLISGVLAAAVALVAFNSLPAGAGVLLGVGLAILNFRLLDAGVAKIETSGRAGDKFLRRLIATKTMFRLVGLTTVVVLLFLVSKPLAVGAAVGLVVFEISFVISVARTMLRSGGMP